MNPFDIFNLLFFAFLVLSGWDIIKGLKDGHFDKFEFRRLVHRALLFFLIYLVVFTMRGYMNYSQLNLLDAPLSYRLAPGADLSVSFSEMDREAACYLYREGIEEGSGWYPSSEKIRQFCSLEYYCNHGSPPTVGSQIWSCMQGNGYLLSFFLGLVSSGISLVVVALVALDFLL